MPASKIVRRDHAAISTPRQMECERRAVGSEYQWCRECIARFLSNAYGTEREAGDRLCSTRGPAWRANLAVRSCELSLRRQDGVPVRQRHLTTRPFAEGEGTEGTTNDARDSACLQGGTCSNALLSHPAPRRVSDLPVPSEGQCCSCVRDARSSPDICSVLCWYPRGA